MHDPRASNVPPTHLPRISHAPATHLPRMSRSLLFPTVLQQTHTEISPSSVLWISRWVSALLLGTCSRTAHSVPALARSGPRALATGRRGLRCGLRCGCGCGSWLRLLAAAPFLPCSPCSTAATSSNPQP